MQQQDDGSRRIKPGVIWLVLLPWLYADLHQDTEDERLNWLLIL